MPLSIIGAILTGSTHFLIASTFSMISASNLYSEFRQKTFKDMRSPEGRADQNVAYILKNNMQEIDGVPLSGVKVLLNKTLWQARTKNPNEYNTAMQKSTLCEVRFN